MHCINYLIWSKRIGTKNLGRKKEINIRLRSISELLSNVAPKLLAIGPWKTLRPLHFDCLLEHRSLSPSPSGPNLQTSLAVHRKTPTHSRSSRQKISVFPYINSPEPRYVACDMLCCGWHEWSPADPEGSAFLHGACLQRNPHSFHRPSPGAFCLEKQSGRASENLSAHTEIFFPSRP